MPMDVATITFPGTGTPGRERNGRMNGGSADESQGRAGVVEEPVVTGDGAERLARPGDQGPRTVRPGQRGPLRPDGDQLAVALEQDRPVPPGGDGHPPGAQAVEHRGRFVRGALDPGGGGAQGHDVAGPV